jgi:hypothetical protein
VKPDNQSVEKSPVALAVTEPRGRGGDDAGGEAVRLHAALEPGYGLMTILVAVTDQSGHNVESAPGLREELGAACHRIGGIQGKENHGVTSVRMG